LFFLIKLLAVYLPFEEFILKWLPVSDQLYLLMRQIPDLMVMSMAAVLLANRLLAGKTVPIIGGRVDVCLALFVCWAFMTILLNPDANVLTNILNIKALLRYILLIYILLLLNPSHMEIKSLFKWLGCAILIQVLIGVFQFLGGTSARDFLAARHVSEGIGSAIKTFTGDRFADRNDLMGTMGDNISFGYFIMLGAVLLLFRGLHLSLFQVLGILMLMAMTFLSGSKAIFLTTLMIGCGYGVWRWGWQRMMLLSFVSLPLVLLMVYLALPADLIASASEAGEQLLQGMMNSRLGILVYIVPKLLLTPQNIIGFAPDKEHFAEYVAYALPMTPGILLAVLPHVLEDVYWAAMYIYYGLVGFVLWCAFLVFMYRSTDVHTPEQAAPVAEVVDVLQTPAFLCRQTDLIRAAAETGKPVNLKKGQFLAPWDMAQVLAKAVATGNDDILLCERGVCFGYNNLVADMRSLVVMRQTGQPVVFDATHAVQQPGGRGSVSGGQREYVPALARAAVATGIAALFMEVHPDPAQARSDGPNSLALDDLAGLLRVLKRLDAVVKADVA